jgi:hypothetical protein
MVTLHFLPGQYVNEGALCAMLGAGRTPGHQVLQRLEIEGLVGIMPRKGVIVRPDGMSEILTILDSPATVEAQLARNAAEQATRGAAEELKALARRGYGNGQPAGIDTFTAGRPNLSWHVRADVRQSGARRFRPQPVRALGPLLAPAFIADDGHQGDHSPLQIGSQQATARRMRRAITSKSLRQRRLKAQRATPRREE